MFLKKKEKSVDVKSLSESLIGYIFSDEMLSKPIYLPEIKSEIDTQDMGLYPLIYIWNENLEKGSFSISINTAPIAHLLEAQVPREHSQFFQIRDKVAEVISQIAQGAVTEACQKANLPPSELFSA